MSLLNDFADFLNGEHGKEPRPTYALEVWATAVASSPDWEEVAARSEPDMAAAIRAARSRYVQTRNMFETWNRQIREAGENRN